MQRRRRRQELQEQPLHQEGEAEVEQEEEQAGTSWTLNHLQVIHKQANKAKAKNLYEAEEAEVGEAQINQSSIQLLKEKKNKRLIKDVN